MFKIVLIGQSKTGKTTIFKNINGSFIYVENIRMMLGTDYYQLQYDHHKIRAKVSLWDINSNIRYLSLYPQFIRGSKAVLIVFDLSNRQSFLNIQYWIGLARSKQIEQPYGFLLGNKVDLQRAVSFDQGIEMASKWGFIYFELCATSQIDVRNLFEEVITFVANRFIQ